MISLYLSLDPLNNFEINVKKFLHYGFYRHSSSCLCACVFMCLLTCVGMNTCGYVYMSMCMYVEVDIKSLAQLPSHVACLNPELMDKMSLARLLIPGILCLCFLGIGITPQSPCIYVGFEDLILSPHICVATALTSEQSLPSGLYFYLPFYSRVWIWWICLNFQECMIFIKEFYIF